MRSRDLKKQLLKLFKRNKKVVRKQGAELSKEIARQYAKMDVSWARGAMPRAMGSSILVGVLGPLLFFYVRRRVSGRELLAAEPSKPVIFVANHSSHLDTPTILRAMPPRWRKRTAVAAAADYFYKSRITAQRRRARLQHGAARPQRRRARQGRDRPRRQADRRGLEPVDVPRGHPLARR